MPGQARDGRSGDTWTGRRTALVGVVAVGLALASSVAAVPASAHSDEGDNHTLEVALSFPDEGLAGEEQLCLGLYKGGTTNFSKPPVQSRCLDPGEDTALFEDIGHGDWVVAAPGIGSEIDPARYQGQLVQTSIPDEPTLSDFGIDVALGLVDDLAGTTGRVQVNVYGCPAGTDAGADPAAWRSECRALAGGIPLSLSGLGTIGETTVEGVTGAEGGEAGRLEFSGLPAGAYRLGGKLPANAVNPAVFIQSNLEGDVQPVAEGESLSVRPTETIAVDVFLVLDAAGDPAAGERKANRSELLGFEEPVITGALSAEDAAEMEAARAEDE